MRKSCNKRTFCTDVERFYSFYTMCSYFVETYFSYFIICFVIIINWSIPKQRISLEYENPTIDDWRSIKESNRSELLTIFVVSTEELSPVGFGLIPVRFDDELRIQEV